MTVQLADSRHPPRACASSALVQMHSVSVRAQVDCGTVETKQLNYVNWLDHGEEP